MFVLHIELKVKPGQPQTLEKTYAESFRPAISAQEGFQAVQLLRSNDDDTDYRLCLTFDHRASQQKWVATDLHQQVWSLVEKLCAQYSVKSYSTV
jgi:heme-degrading monooxygenase HmoA